MDCVIVCLLNETILVLLVSVDVQAHYHFLREFSCYWSATGSACRDVSENELFELLEFLNDSADVK